MSVMTMEAITWYIVQSSALTPLTRSHQRMPHVWYPQLNLMNVLAHDNTRYVHGRSHIIIMYITHGLPQASWSTTTIYWKCKIFYIVWALESGLN